MLRLYQTNVCPPDKFLYRFLEDGVLIEAIDRDVWFGKIEKHYRDNNYAMPYDWQAQAEAQLCATLPPGWCRYEDGSDPNQFINRRFQFDDAMRGTKVLVEFIKQGAPLVAPEIAEARAKTCAACYACLNIPGCGSCSGFANFVSEVAGARATAADPIIGSKVCGVCLCSARANVWIPVSVSRVSVTPEQMGLFPDFCWKKQEILDSQPLT